jgi:hypothetical protein
VVSEMERWEQFKKLSLLRSWSAKLCLAIVGPSWERNHLFEKMWAASICHIEMAGELAALQTTVTSVAESMLGCSPDETFRVEIMDELVTQFQKLEDLCLRLERPDVKIYDLLLVLPPDQAR